MIAGLFSPRKEGMRKSLPCCIVVYRMIISAFFLRRSFCSLFHWRLALAAIFSGDFLGLNAFFTSVNQPLITSAGFSFMVSDTAAQSQLIELIDKVSAG